MNVTTVIPYTHTFKSGAKGSAKIVAEVNDTNTIVTHFKATGGKERMDIPTEALVRLAESVVSNKKAHDMFLIKSECGE